MAAKMTRDRGLKTGHPVIQSCCQGREGETAAEYVQICGVTPEKEKGVFFTQTGFVSAQQYHGYNHGWESNYPILIFVKSLFHSKSKYMS